MTGTHILFYFLTKLHSIHNRHHDVRYYNIRNPRLCQFPTLLSVFGSNHFINISKRTFYILTDIRVILHHEHNGTSVQSRFHSGYILRWNGQFFHLALHMNGIGISVFRQQAQSKGGSHFRCTLHFQRTFVQISKPFHQCQTNT